MGAFMIHGSRGSYPVSGEAYRRYGGHTTCFSLETEEGLLIVDGGTGISVLGETLNRRTTLPPITLLLTHLHLDHVIGLPSFTPLLRDDIHLTLMADSAVVKGWQKALSTIMGKPFWPFELLKSGADIRFEDLPSQTRGPGIMGPITLHGIDVSWCPVWHPQGCVSYRLAFPGVTVVVGTDREHGNEQLDPIFRELCKGVDVLIHDAQYTPREFPARVGWGHSTWEEGVTLAAASGAKRLILTSHDPVRSDEAVDRLVGDAQQIFPNTLGATGHMAVTE